MHKTEGNFINQMQDKGRFNVKSNFINDIKLTKYKCFKDFEISSLKRVNLIGGKNNIGKTAFMEACYVVSNSFRIFKSDNNYKPNIGSSVDRTWFHFEIIKLIISIRQNRDMTSFLLEWLLEEFTLANTNSFHIEMNKKFRLSLDKNILTPEHFGTRAWGNWGSIDISNFRKNLNYPKIYKKNHKPIINNYTFSSICNANDMKDMIDDLKLNEKYVLINNHLQEIFDIDQIDIIKNKIMLRQNNKFKELNDFGDGVKHFINILVILFSNENTSVYFDEIENGIHFSNLDNLWKIILTVSKKQNIQVFATTHSQECIDSFSKMSNLQIDEDVNFINLSNNKNNEIVSIVLDKEMLLGELEQNHEVRAW